MAETPLGRHRQHTRARAALLAYALGAITGWGCGPAPEPDAPPDLSRSVEADWLEAALVDTHRPAPEDELVVRLAFGAGADLDLFVSDPQSETVYFANQEARSGGSFAEDLRCDAPSPRIETVRFERPLPGRYRIGIDYPGACGDDPNPAIFVVEWRLDDLGDRVRGRIQPLVFDNIALEFELPAAGIPAAR
jgi:hypothetical protein